MRRQRLLVGVGTLALAGLYVAWPYFVVRPALLADAREDVFRIGEVDPLEKLENQRSVPVGKVIVLHEGLRLRVVSDSHHNNFIGYSGSTFVNVNNGIFFHSEGHCAPDWIMAFDDLSTVTEETFVADLVRRGYRQVAGPR